MVPFLSHPALPAGPQRPLAAHGSKILTLERIVLERVNLRANEKDSLKR